jgi:hypothetical protein
MTDYLKPYLDDNWIEIHTRNNSGIRISMEAFSRAMEKWAAEIRHDAMTALPAKAISGKLLTTREAWTKAQIGERQFRRDIKAGLVKPLQRKKHGKLFFEIVEIERYMRSKP